MMKIKGNIRGMVYASAIAAIYVVLTLVSAAAGLSGGVIQFRLSEALTVLPVFTGAAVPGLFIGCAIANLVTGALPWDVAIGSIQLGAPPVELQPTGLLKEEIQRLCIGAGRGLYYLLVCGVLYEHGVILHVLLMDAQKVQGQEQQRSRDEQCEHAL